MPGLALSGLRGWKGGKRAGRKTERKEVRRDASDEKAARFGEGSRSDLMPLLSTWVPRVDRKRTPSCSLAQPSPGHPRRPRLVRTSPCTLQGQLDSIEITENRLPSG